MDVFYQNGIKYTALQPHTVEPKSELFARQVDYFDRVCRTVAGMRKMRVASIGARTGPFKTVRIDELTLQKYGISMETFDLSGIIANMAKVNNHEINEKYHLLDATSDWSAVPAKAKENLARLSVVLDRIIDEYQLDAIAMRCWLELQEQAGISPCVLLGILNEQGKVASCEVDVGSAVMMYALKLATGSPAACLDWNNNYGDDENKCILFHCGPVPMSLMTGRGKITDHSILANAVGPGLAFGCTVGNLATHNGEIDCYLGQGEFTCDPVPSDFFGCAGVAKIHRLQDVLLQIGRRGHRHHVGLAEGNAAQPMNEALGYYLGYQTAMV
jgi:L-fucose isomerase-like protein